MQKHLLIICGSTAVGKTALSVQLAKHYSTEVISADSRQLYKEMSIGTAKPTVQEMEGVPHHFIDCISIQQNYTAGDYEKEVIKKLDELFAQHDIVVMCGGTGLYIDAVCKGFYLLNFIRCKRNAIFIVFKPGNLSFGVVTCVLLN